MNKRNRIIVLIDLSEYSENLVNFAFHLAEHINAQVVLVHQITIIVPGMADQESRMEIIQIEKEEATSKIWKLIKGRSFSADSFYISQKPILAILEELKADHLFDWVLAGLKGTGILKRFFIGSTTLSVVNDSDLMTVAVPVHAPVAVPKKLLVGVNPKYELNQLQFSAMLSALAGQLEEVTFFTILKDEKQKESAIQYLNYLQEEFKDYQPSCQIFQGENVFADLRRHVEQKKDAFLVLQQGERSLMDNMFRKFMINELVYTALTPLIVISK